MKAPRVLVCLTNGNDACSWYRGIGPWSEIHRQGLAEVYYSAKPKWQDVRAVDAVFMLRPCTKEMAEGIQAAKDFSRPLVLDYDDDLTCLPRDNPAYALFSLPDIQQNLKQYLKAADAVVSSTEFLGEQLKKKANRVVTIRNAYDHHLNKFRSEAPVNKSVLWRGTGTHDRDIASVADQIVEVAAAHPDFLFIFMGDDPAPWTCSERIKNVMRVNKLDLMHYFKAISALRPRVVIAPLADTPFNRGKSNIAAIEAAFAGAPCIAPPWQDWVDAGAVTYIGPPTFREKLEKLMTCEEYRNTMADSAWALVQENFSLRAANEQRMDLIRGLIG